MSWITDFGQLLRSDEKARRPPPPLRCRKTFIAQPAQRTNHLPTPFVFIMYVAVKNGYVTILYAHSTPLANPVDEVCNSPYKLTPPVPSGPQIVKLYPSGTVCGNCRRKVPVVSILTTSISFGK